MSLRVDHFIRTPPANPPISNQERLFIARPFFFIRVPITNLIPSYDSRQGPLRQVPVGLSWRAVGEVTAISLWDNKANAEAYNNNIYPDVVKTLARVLDGTPKVQSGEVVNSTIH